MTRILLLATALMLSACMGNSEQQHAMNWGNMYTHDARISQVTTVAMKPAPKVKTRNLISPGIY